MKVWLFFLGIVFLGSTGARGEPVSPSTLSGNPFSQPMFTARLVSTELAGRVGSPTKVQIQLAPQTIPFGHFIVSLAEVIKGPAGLQADILTGYPEIKITPHVAGDYQIMVRVNLVIKSSCAGAEASTLLKQIVHLRVVPE